MNLKMSPRHQNHLIMKMKMLLMKKMMITVMLNMIMLMILSDSAILEKKICNNSRILYARTHLFSF